MDGEINKHSEVELNYSIIENPLADDTFHDVVFLHGLLSNGNVFKPFAENLITRDKVKRVILVDLLNHGMSPHHSVMNYSDMANDVDRLIEKIGVEKYILITHSMGSKTGMVMSIQKENKDKIKGLVILDTFPMDYTKFKDIYKHTLPMLEMLVQFDLSKFEKITDVIKYISENYESKSLPYFLTFMDQNFIQNPETNRITWKINIKGIYDNFFNVIGFDTPEETSKYDGPILVLLGEKSFVFDEDSFSKISSKYNKETDIKYIKDATHWIYIDAPEEFSKEVSLFINKI